MKFEALLKKAKALEGSVYQECINLLTSEEFDVTFFFKEMNFEDNKDFEIRQKSTDTSMESSQKDSLDKSRRDSQTQNLFDPNWHPDINK